MPQNPTPAQPTTPPAPKAPATPGGTPPTVTGGTPPTSSAPTKTPATSPAPAPKAPVEVKPLQPQPLPTPKSTGVATALTGKSEPVPVKPAVPTAPATPGPTQAPKPAAPAPVPASTPAPKPPQGQVPVAQKPPAPPKSPTPPTQPAPVSKPVVQAPAPKQTTPPPAPAPKPTAPPPAPKSPAGAPSKPSAGSPADGDVTLPPPSKIQKMPPPTPAPTPAPKPVGPTASSAPIASKPVPAKDSGKTLPPPPAPPASGGAGKPPVTLPSTSPGPVAPSVPAKPPTPASTGGTLLPAPATPGGTPPTVTGGTPAGTPPGASSAPKATQMAELKKSPLRFLPFILGGFLILGLIFFIFSRLFGGRSTPTPTTPGTTGTGTQQTGGGAVTITYWGLWEPSGVIQEVISDFEAKNPKIKVNYQQQSYNDYRERLQTAIVSGRGPDVFRFHASWTPMLTQELSPAPTSVYPDTEFADTFYPIAVDQLTLNDRAVGVPLMYDGLALYYNTEVLRTANAQPPKTWAEVKELASRLTIRSGAKIERAGMAIGNAGNVEHFSDILGLLMLQNGADPRKPSGQAAQDALLFYTNFVKVDKVWDSTLPSSTVAFARGDVAMMLAPSWRAHEIQALNPNLKFGIAPVPQLAGKKVTWATYWAEGVSAQSKYKAEAWTFLKYLSSEESLRKFYSEASKVRGFGEIYSRRDMANELANDPMLGAFVSDAPDARNWYMNSFTHDNGLNDLLIKYYEDAINAVIESGEPKAALETVEQGSNQILRQYGIPTTSSAVSAQ